MERRCHFDPQESLALDNPSPMLATSCLCSSRPVRHNPSKDKHNYAKHMEG